MQVIANDDTAYLNKAAVRTVIWVVALYVLWTGAWVLERALEPRLPWFATAGGSFVYWTVMKLAVWVAPALLLLRPPVISVRRRALLWGSALGLLTGLMALAGRIIGHQPLFRLSPSWALVNAVAVAPVVEEIAFRGALLPALLKRYRFAVANSITALLFLGAHLPGWYFQGRLRPMLTAPAGGALSIFLIGLLFGWAAYRGKSISASILAHSLNNFFNA